MAAPLIRKYNLGHPNSLFVFVCFSYEGFSTNHGAVERWTLTASYRASLRQALLQHLNVKCNGVLHTDLTPSRMKRDEEDVNSILDVVKNTFLHPFKGMEITCLSSGILAEEKVENDLINAYKIGGEKMNKFIEERLVNKNIDFFDPIKKSRLGTFTTMTKKVRKFKMEIVSLTL